MQICVNKTDYLSFEMNCLLCSRNLAGKEETVACGACGRTYHASCMQVTSADLKYLKEAKSTLKCSLCLESGRKLRSGSVSSAPSGISASSASMATPKKIQLKMHKAVSSPLELSASDSDRLVEPQEIASALEPLLQKIVKDELLHITATLDSLRGENAALNRAVIEQKQMILDLTAALREQDTQSKSLVSEKKCSSVSYADKVTQQEPVVIIEPKPGSKNDNAANEIRGNLDPTKIAVSGLRTTSRGSVVVGCKNRSAADRLKVEAKNVLGDRYNVREPKVVKPRIKIVDISEELEFAEMERLVRLQNEEIFSDSSSIKVVHLRKSASKRDFVAVAEFDAESNHSVLEAAHVCIGWDRCRVFDGFDLMRCYKCNDFNHKAKDCSKKLICPKCCGPHRPRECQIDEDHMECSNCKYAVEKLKMKVDTHHPAWSKSCPVYLKKLEVRRRLSGFLS